MAIVADRIEHELHIEAPPEVVFAYFTEPARHVEWMGQAANLDPRPGGVYEMTVNDNATVLGEYVSLEPPHLIEFTWGFVGNDAVPPGSANVRVTLTDADGGTRLRLVHTGLPHPALAPHDEGWTGYLAALAREAYAKPA